MARAIDGDKLLEKLQKKKAGPANKRYTEGFNDCLMRVRSMVHSAPTLTPPNEPLSPYPDGDMSIIACPHCGSGEYLHNEDGNEQNYCGQCGQAIDWSRPPEGAGMKTATFFSTREELRELTGLPADDHDAALWDAGFDLDDWDFGFVSDEPWSKEGWFSKKGSFYEYWILSRMERYCVGYKHTEYNGRHYYMMYHS